MLNILKSPYNAIVRWSNFGSIFYFISFWNILYSFLLQSVQVSMTQNVWKRSSANSINMCVLCVMLNAKNISNRAFMWMYIFKGLYPDRNVHGANMGPSWGRQDPGWTHVGPMNFAIWVVKEMRDMWKEQGHIIRCHYCVRQLCCRPSKIWDKRYQCHDVSVFSIFYGRKLIEIPFI